MALWKLITLLYFLSARPLTWETIEIDMEKGAFLFDSGHLVCMLNTHTRSKGRQEQPIFWAGENLIWSWRHEHAENTNKQSVAWPGRR